MGPPGVRKSYFSWELDPFNDRNMHFPDMFQRPQVIVQLPHCNIFIVASKTCIQFKELQGGVNQLQKSLNKS